ncbi:hypothetical protein [Lysinibacillus capsici]|uniref:hypothetical protein n=1 Tax=Lysinibacillus capsici TaxID=2115968 RepID=UPI00289E3A06|nr:hypothetical protein [Lysinibacillus capsici]
MAKMYQDILPKEIIESLKTSEIKEMREIEESLTNNYVVLAIISFAWAVLLIAFLLWMNKFTLFLVLISTLALFPFATASYLTYKKYLKALKAIVEKRGVEK